MNGRKLGDNPFHSVSHPSLERAMTRGNDISRLSYAADLVRKSLENGADGFMLTVSETTLSIPRILGKGEEDRRLRLYVIVHTHMNLLD